VTLHLNAALEELIVHEHAQQRLAATLRVPVVVTAPADGPARRPESPGGSGGLVPAQRSDADGVRALPRQ
jgi:hypothetical protein